MKILKLLMLVVLVLALSGVSMAQMSDMDQDQDQMGTGSMDQQQQMGGSMDQQQQGMVSYNATVQQGPVVRTGYPASADVFVNGKFALRIPATAGGMSPMQRARMVADRLLYIFIQPYTHPKHPHSPILQYALV